MGGDGGIGTFDDLEKRLLHALARHVTRDGEVFGLAGDLVYLVDVDDTHLRAIDIVIGGGDELEQDVFDVLAYISGLGERRCVGNGKGDVEYTRERLGQKRLATACGTEQQDVALGKLDLVILGTQAQGNALVVIVDGNGKRLLGIFLADDVLRQLSMNLDGCRQGLKCDEAFGATSRSGQPLALHGIVFLVDDVGAEPDTLVANVDALAGDELVYLVLGLSAKRAAQLAIKPMWSISHVPNPSSALHPTWQQRGT